MNDLARLFQACVQMNRPEDDMSRDAVLNVLHEGASKGTLAFVRPSRGAGQTFVSSPNGDRFVIEPEMQDPIVNFEFYPATNVLRYSFWMNRSSVKDLLAAIEPRVRVSDTLFEAWATGTLTLGMVNAPCPETVHGDPCVHPLNHAGPHEGGA